MPKTVLVVEDDSAVCQLTAVILQGQGYAVLTARNGQEALRACANHQGSIDLMLTDVEMGDGLNGIELAEIVHEEQPGIKIVVMSGKGSAETVRKSKLTLPFLRKRFTPDELLAKIAEALGQ